MGIDPLYVGEATAQGMTARIELMVDFYDDHLYGEARASVTLDEGWGDEFVELIVTGDRNGADLEGQFVERWAQPRRFDAVFTAQLITASEIVGTATVSSDDGTLTVPFHLYRISPCGCDLAACTQPSDCPPEHECEQGVCQPGCAQECCQDADCGADERCENNVCVPDCQADCCDNSDCTGSQECVDGQCLTPCQDRCDCDTGEECVNGYCQAS